MSQPRRQLALAVFLTRHGHHPGAWRQPDSVPAGLPDFAHWTRAVQTAERGLLDAAFFADRSWRSSVLINLGYGDPARLHPRNPRLAFDEACTIE